MNKTLFNFGKIVLLIVLLHGNMSCADKTSSLRHESGDLQKEYLDRGLIALTRSDTSIYIGWRLLEDDPSDVAFNLYRKMVGSVEPNDYVKVNDQPITHSTNYIDRGCEYHGPAAEMPKLFEAHLYKLTRIINGKEEEIPGGEVYVFFNQGNNNSRSILLENPNVGVIKIGIGDLDGDGAYDFVVLRDAMVHVDPGTCIGCWQRSRDTYKLEAYSSKGEFMWRYDMGWAIETGVWFAPFMVFDLDGDGKAEVYTKAGEEDPREPDGRVISGPEYLVKLDGETGKIVKKREWLPRNIEIGRSYDWTSRNFLGLAYLDGKKPSLLMQRGTYGHIRVETMDMELKTEWYWESSEMNRRYWGQGGHRMAIADIDEDGKDEVVPGTFALDHDGTALWGIGLNHNDCAVIADIDPERLGLEIFFNIETGAEKNGVCLVDAATGEIIWGYDQPTNHIHDRATVGDYDPTKVGMECYTQPDRGDTRPFFYSSKGERLPDPARMDNALPLWWDADETKELWHNGRLFKFNGDTLERDIQGGLIADIYGDWREEIIVGLPGEIRIYSTTIPASTKKVCLMQNHQYRMDVASFSVGYPVYPQLGLDGNSKSRTFALNRQEIPEWGDKLMDYAIKQYHPAETYHWDWSQATLLRSIVDRWENNIQKETMLAYIRKAMDVNMERASGIHPNALASGFGIAFLARVTGEDQYREKAFDLYNQYLKIPRSSNGGVSHRDNVIELWDDTVYMIGLFLIEMYRLTGDENFLREVALQLRTHAEKLEDPSTGLWYHGWDNDDIAFDDKCCMPGWADNPKRRNNEFWGRGNGWVAMTLANTLRVMPESMPEKRELKAKFDKMMQTLSKLQDEKTGHWYQLPIYPGEKGNFIESSSTVMFAYAMALGVTEGILDADRYFPLIENTFRGIEKYSLKDTGAFLTVTNVCYGTCIGDKSYYYARKVIDGTEYALGSAVMFYDQYTKLKNEFLTKRK